MAGCGPIGVRFQAGALWLCVALSGCAASPPQLRPASPEAVSYPSWVRRGSANVVFGGERTFFGVGVVFGIRNPTLQRHVADGRARAEVAKMVESFAVTLVANYVATLAELAARPAADGLAERPALEPEQRLKLVTAVTLIAIVVVERWQQPEAGDMYSLARLELRTVLDGLGRVKELDDDFVAFARRRAADAWGGVSPNRAAISSLAPISPPPDQQPAPSWRTP